MSSEIEVGVTQDPVRIDPQVASMFSNADDRVVRQALLLYLVVRTWSKLLKGKNYVALLIFCVFFCEGSVSVDVLTAHQGCFV